MNRPSRVLFVAVLTLFSIMPLIYQNCSSSFHALTLGSTAPSSDVAEDPQVVFRNLGVNINGALPFEATGKISFMIQEGAQQQPVYSQILESGKMVYPLRVFDPKISAAGSRLNPAADFVPANEVFVVNSDQGAGLSFVKGLVKDGTVYAQREQIQTVANKTASLQATSALTTGSARKMMVILTQFSNANLRISKADYENMLGGGGSSVKSVFNRASNNQGTLETTIVGPITLPYPRENCSRTNNDCENMYKWWNRAVALADDAGAFRQVAYSQWDHIWIVFPSTDCSNIAGMANFYARSGWIHEYTTNQEDIRETIIHEMGHNLGLGHAMAKKEMRINHYPTSDDPIRMEYGDETSTMGTADWYATDPLHNVVHQNHLGVIDNNGMRAVNATGEYELIPYNSPGNTNGTRALQVGDFFISLAPPSGGDLHSAWHRKILVHKIERNLMVNGLLAPKTELIANLPPGSTASIPSAAAPLFRISYPATGAPRAAIEMNGTSLQPHDFNISIEKRVSESSLDSATNVVAGSRYRYSVTTIPNANGIALARVEIALNDVPKGEVRLTDTGAAQNAWLENTNYETQNTLKISVRAVGTNGAVRTKEMTVSNSSPFSDVPLTHPKIVPMLIMARAGVWGGCDAESGTNGTRYCPDQSVTRAHMAKMIVKAMKVANNLGSTNPNSTTPYFQDVPSGHPQFGWIQRMWELGITVGTQARDLTSSPPKQRLYGPDQPTNRGQMAVFLSRAWSGALNAEKTDDGPESLARALSSTDFPECTFSDVPSSHTFFGAIESLCHDGVARGCDESPRTGQSASTYCPGDAVPHWMMATFVARTFGWAD